MALARECPRVAYDDHVPEVYDRVPKDEIENNEVTLSLSKDETGELESVSVRRWNG